MDEPSAPVESLPQSDRQPAATEVATCFVSSTECPSLAILDTGASRCVVGENVWKRVLSSLPGVLQNQIRIHDSQVRFRFGNNQSLTSSFRVQVPLLNQSSHKRLWLSIEVVPGNTPFLFSKRAFKQLGGILNTTDDTCFLQRLNRSIDLSLSKTELYLIDIAKLCLPDRVPSTNPVSESFHAGVTELHESVEHRNPDAGVHVSHPIANRSSVKSLTSSSSSTSESVCHATGTDADHFERNCGDSVESTHPAPPSDDASDRRGKPSTIRDPGHDDQHDARASSTKKPLARDDESTKPSLTFRGHKWTPDWSSFSGRSCTSRTSLDKTSCRDFVATFVVSSGGRRDPVGGASGGGSHSQLQPSSSSCSSEPIGGDLTSSIHTECNSGDTWNSGGTSWNQHGSISAFSCPQHGRVGTSWDHLGKEASRSNISICSNSRPRVCDLEHGSLSHIASRSTRFLPVLPVDGSGQLKMDPRFSIDKSFRKSVTETRNFLKKNPQQPGFDVRTSKSFEHAARIAEEAFVSPQSSVVSEPLILLEVYANEHSSLTEAFQKRGLSAMRFTKRDGDLATVEGRRKLWDVISKYQPAYIWVAPECGPWSGWSRLNQFKSLRLFVKIESERQQQRAHIELCGKLCRLQKDRNRHFCLEQPLSSQMPHVEEFQDILKLTVKATFDMCAFGLKIPGTDRFLRKSSMVFTTDTDLAHELEKSRCRQDHIHQPIAGSVSVKHQRQALSQFCASYCRGFAVKIARIIGRRFQEAFHEDESPPKKLRFSHNLHKRARLDDSSRNSDPIDLDADELTAPGTSSAEPDPNQAPASVGRSPGSEASWNLILSMADRCAPRVGNIRYGADSEITQHMQRLVPGMHIQYVFVCRGTERFQLPSQATTDFPIRYTVCQHRHTGAVHDFGLENWVELKRSLRIRASVPSKICVTAFGTSLNVPVAESPVVPPMPLAVEQPDLPSIPEEPIIPETMNPVVPKNLDLCEGWAPPPTPLHGPKFRALSNQEKSDLALVHRNLGHPDPNVLSAHLKVQGADQRIVEAALEYVCDACVESVGKKHQRPAKLHDPLEFNQLVGVDGFFWSGKQGFQVHVFHCIDEASLFHLGRRLKTRNPDHTMNIWNEFWTSWAGNPQRLYSDPAGEFRSQEWKTALQARNICPEITTEAWQRGRVERHGDILKSMISRCDQESPIQTPEQFDRVLIMCCQAKNSLSRHQGYSPEQIVLGKAVSLPASICSDENLSAHSLALGNDQDSERFRRHLDQRSRARRAFLLTDNDQALRRALYRKSRPTRGPFLPNQLVMYWMKRNKSSRHECGRWHGPAKVILQESNSGVWISHMDRLFRCAPESLRPASLREWNSSTGSPMFGPQHIVSEPSEIPSGSIVDSNTYNWPDVEPSPTTPGDPPGETSEAPVSPQLSGQPESEVVPESLNPSDVLTPQVSSQEPAGPSISGVLDGASVPIDLESSDDQEDSLTSISQPILHCEALISQQEDLSSWDILHTDQTSSDLLLAHDELVLHAEPLTCCEEQCYCLEIDLNENDIHKWYNEVKPEAMIHVASVSKRARAEVQVKNLSLEERILFEKAKDAELNCWIQTNALRPVLRRSLNPEQILKSRWVLTWKNLEDSSAQPNHSSQHSRKAKARLVVLGFQDPKLTEVARDAPTLTREGRNTILQTIASMKWRLSSFDIKTAFLRGKADDSNPLAMEPPIELRKKLGLTDQQVCSLIGNAYGRVDAPLLFYKELVGQLKKLNFQVHPLEPCLFILESQGPKGRILHGVLGTHVDDGICGGDQYFHDQISKLKEVLPFGAFKQQRFVFTGIALEQLPDFSISANQEDYVHAIPAIDIGRLRRQRPDAPIQESELTKLRGLVGSLQYAVTHTRPDIAAKLGEIQSQMSRGTVATLIAANKVLREAQEFAHVKICFRHIPVSEVSHVSFGDASFASPKQLSSHQGTIICATNQKLNSNEQAPISPLIWTSKKISRVVRSTLSAEAFSMSRSVDQLGWMRLLWGVLVIPNFDWRNPIVGLKQLPVSIIVTDCKSLYDLVTRLAMPSCEEYRTTLEVLLIRERCSEHSVFRWVPTSLQLADPLTKAMDAALLRAVLASGEFQLFDEEASLRCNSERKQAISWIKSKSQSHQ